MDDRKVAEDIFLQAMGEMRFAPSKEKRASPASSDEGLVVDFHGFTVERALQRLDEILELKRKKKLHAVSLIVGRGSHSETIFPLVKREVEAVLEERGIPYRYEKGVIYL